MTDKRQDVGKCAGPARSPFQRSEKETGIASNNAAVVVDQAPVNVSLTQLTGMS